MSRDTKLIRVLDRKVIPTSRGTCRGPIGPYRETYNQILVLISRGYKVVEVLENGNEIPLDENNFDRDNSNEVVVNATSEDSYEETPAESNNNQNSQPPETNRQLSKKERRQKAKEQREQQQRNNNQEPNKVEETSTENTVVPEDAVEE